MTIKEIAKLAGVSTATVSYVINNSAPVREETKERIRSIIKETGYTGNSIAKSLRVNKTKTLGIIVEDMRSEQVPIIIDGIHEAAELYGYKTLVSNMRLQYKQQSTHLNSNFAYKELESSIRTLQSMQVDGLLYVGSHNENLETLPTSVKPMVLCNCSCKGSNLLSVNYNNEETAYMVTKALLDMGHYRIGLITGYPDSFSVIERKKGYQRALDEYLIPFDASYIVDGSWGFHKGKEAAKTLLSLATPPSIIFTMNDAMAIGAYEAATEMGYQVPSQLSIIGFDNAESAKYLRPRLSTVALPLKDMGARAAEYIIKSIDGETIHQKQLELSCNLVLRSSTSLHKELYVLQC